MFGIWVGWRDNKVFQNYDWKLMEYRVVTGVLQDPNTQLNTIEPSVQYTTEFFPHTLMRTQSNIPIFNNTFLELFRNIYGLWLQASHKAYFPFSFTLSRDRNDNGLLPGPKKTSNIFCKKCLIPCTVSLFWTSQAVFLRARVLHVKHILLIFEVRHPCCVNPVTYLIVQYTKSQTQLYFN